MSLRLIKLYANMGSCQCGDIGSTIIIDDENKEFYTEGSGSHWSHGAFNKVTGVFSVPYAGVADGLVGYHHFRIVVDGDIYRDVNWPNLLEFFSLTNLRKAELRERIRCGLKTCGYGYKYKILN